MTAAPTISGGRVDAVDVPLDASLAAHLVTAGLHPVLTDRTRTTMERLTPHLADPMAADSRAAYTAWLRRQLAAWGALRLPTVAAAAVDWPLTTMRPQNLDVVGLIVADLRELSPRTRPTVVPASATSPAPVPAGVAVGIAALCVRTAALSSRLLAPAMALTAGLTATGSATRYLTCCTELAAGAVDLAREADVWAARSGPETAFVAVRTAEVLAVRLADALDAGVRKGW